MANEHRKKIIRAGVLDIVFVSLSFLAISFFVGEEKGLLFGYWTVPAVFLVVFIVYFFLLLSPGLKAHARHQAWRGAAYEAELEQELKTKGYTVLLRMRWFTKHLKLKEKEAPAD